MEFFCIFNASWILDSARGDSSLLWGIKAGCSKQEAFQQVTPIVKAKSKTKNIWDEKKERKGL